MTLVPRAMALVPRASCILLRASKMQLHMINAAPSNDQCEHSTWSQLWLHNMNPSFWILHIYKKHMQNPHIPKTYADSTYTKNICRIHIHTKYICILHIYKKNICRLHIYKKHIFDKNSSHRACKCINRVESYIILHAASFKMGPGPLRLHFRLVFDIFRCFFWLRTATARAPANGFAWKLDEMISEFRSFPWKHQNANPGTFRQTFWQKKAEKHMFLNDFPMFLDKTAAQNVVNA